MDEEPRPAKIDFRQIKPAIKQTNEDKKKRNFIYMMIAVSVIAICLISIFIIRPAVIGYATYSDMKKTNQDIGDYSKSVDELQSQIIVYETNMSSCQSYNDKLLEEFKASSVTLSECSSKLTAATINYGNLKNNTDEQLFGLQEQIAAKEEAIKNLQSDYDAIAQNTANNLCCKARVDNPSINFYKVENNKIVCLEEGEKKISC